MEKYTKRYQMVYENWRKKKIKIYSVRYQRVLPINKEALLVKVKNFAEKLVNITNEDKAIIKHANKSLSNNNSETWMKKDSGLFNVTMGDHDGAEVCELRNIHFIQTFFKI